MGFLLGAFGKQMAGTRYRSLQARLMHISSRARRVHNQMDRLQKALERNKKAELNALSAQNAMANMTAQQQLSTALQGILPELGISADAKSIPTDKQFDYNAKYNAANAAYQTSKAQWDMQIAAEKQRIEEYYDDYQESLIEPLKMEEEELQSEKERLESQVTMAKQDYEACQKMEQADAKMLQPNYTGAQG